MTTGRTWNLLGLEVLKRVLTKEKNRVNYRIILFKVFLLGIGYATLHGENIHITIGITKLEIFTSFTIKKRWLM